MCRRHGDAIAYSVWIYGTLTKLSRIFTTSWQWYNCLRMPPVFNNYNGVPERRSLNQTDYPFRHKPEHVILFISVCKNCTSHDYTVGNLTLMLCLTFQFSQVACPFKTVVWLWLSTQTGPYELPVGSLNEYAFHAFWSEGRNISSLLVQVYTCFLFCSLFSCEFQ